MKLLQINTSDIEGGAARAAYRLYKGLQRINDCEVKMLVQSKKTDEEDIVVCKDPRKVQRIFRRIKSKLDASISQLYYPVENVPWSAGLMNNSTLFAMEDYISCDLIHLHWICGGYVSINDIAKINKPIVWTLHDTWAMTGGCHYFGKCTKYYDTQCAKCEQLGKKNRGDLSAYLFRKKQNAYQNANISIVVTPSKWLANCASQSRLLQGKRIEVIANGIDTSVYRGVDRQSARNIFNIPIEEKIILFGAINSSSDSRKGYKYLKTALINIKKTLIDNNSLNIRLLVFGASKPSKEEDLGFPVKYLGHLYDDVSLSLLYNCADVFVAPSKEDNLPNTVMESLACGTPCVAFNIGGMPDMIEHKKNGYLAKPYNEQDLANGIRYVIDLPNEKWWELSTHARRKVESEFAIDIIANKYRDLYNSILDK